MKLPNDYVRGLPPASGIKPGRVYVLAISHDDDCPKLTGGPCRCTPDVELMEVPEVQS